MTTNNTFKSFEHQQRYILLFFHLFCYSFKFAIDFLYVYLYTYDALFIDTNRVRPAFCECCGMANHTSIKHMKSISNCFTYIFLERNFSGLFEIITLYVCLCNVKGVRVFNFDDLSVSSLWWLHIRMICECKR